MAQLTAQRIADIANEKFTALGIDPEAGFSALVHKGVLQTQLRTIDLKIEALSEDQRAAMYPIDQQRTLLQQQRAAVVTALST